MAKDKDYQQLIHTERWLRLRKDKLTASPLCERCQQQGIVTPATEVHHVTPVEDGLTLAAKRRLMYDPHNLRALCAECHERNHPEKRNKKKRKTLERIGSHGCRVIKV